MKIKVCGMKYPDNISSIKELGPDYLGFIFYPKSKRFAGDLDPEIAKNLKDVTKVGVFVNEAPEKINSICKKFGLNHIQLHGEESPEECIELKALGYTIIKVFSVGRDFDFKGLEKYEGCADYFLFDTKSESYGGTGKKFDWSIFKNYHSKKPIFLSGGIGPDDVEEIKMLKNLPIHSLDINSRFETEPGLKNAELVKQFIHKMK